jgi:hypothetical protein
VKRADRNLRVIIKPHEKYYMIKFQFIFILLFTLFGRPCLSETGIYSSKFVRLDIIDQDTIRENQILYNGRVWRNLFYMVKEDQFLFSNDFLPGSVTMDGNTFNNISIKFDIYNDEIITQTNHGSILQLNKEMVDSFKIIFQGKTFYFTNLPADSLKGIKGYLNVLYDRKSALYVRYKKEIEMLAVERKYDMFFQTYKIFFVKDGIVHTLLGKNDLINILKEYKVPIREFIKKNKLRISKKRPESFVPVIEYYDSISK